jgi:hypothetical protein
MQAVGGKIRSAVKVNEKLSRCRPGQALGVPGS